MEVSAEVKWSAWRWSYDPIRGRYIGRYGNGTHIKGFRFFSFVFWKFAMADNDAT